MKQIIIAAMFFAVALASVFVACNKENVEPASTVQPENAVQMSDAEVESRILNFKQKLASTEKSGEEMSIDNVVWFTEAALNYTHCIVFEDEEIETNATMLDSAFISVNPTEGTLTMAQIQEAYNTMENFALGKLKAIESTAKRIAVVDVEFDAQNSDLKIYAMFVYYDSEIEPDKSGFSMPDLNFNWRNGAGGCYTGRCEGGYENKSA